MRALPVVLAFAVWVAPGLCVAQTASATPRPNDTLPDWSGVWSMVGGTVFDRATQTGQGGAVSVGVRSHPPYNAEWEAIYKSHLERRDKNLFPDTISNCGVPAGFPRHFNLPDPYEFVVRPEQVWVLTENGPNVLRIYTDGRKHLDDQWETYTRDSVGHWEGDTLVVEENPSPPDGSVVAALILDREEEATVKVLRRQGETIRLEARSGAHEDIVVPADRVVVQGTVEWVIRRVRGRR